MHNDGKKSKNRSPESAFKTNSKNKKRILHACILSSFVFFYNIILKIALFFYK